MGELAIIPVSGGYQVCREEKIVLGLFPKEVDAALFRDAITAREQPSEPFVKCLAKPTAETGPAAPAVAETEVSPSPAAQAPAPAEVSPGYGATAKTHPALFAQAEARLIDGDELKTVAAEMEIPMARLRGWWASRKKSSGDRSGPGDVARRAPEGLSDEDEDELLRICHSDDVEEGFRSFAGAHGLSVGDCQRLADKLLARGT